MMKKVAYPACDDGWPCLDRQRCGLTAQTFTGVASQWPWQLKQTDGTWTAGRYIWRCICEPRADNFNLGGVKICA